MSLLTALIVRKSPILAGIFYIFLKSVLNQTWNAFNTKTGLSEKLGKAVIK